MAFKEFDTPLQVSYLDLYGFANTNLFIKKATIDKVKQYNKDMLMGMPILEREDVDAILWQMGMDTKREVEECFVFHRPNCLTYNCDREDKPKVFGLTYQGYERTDEEWKEFKRKNNL